MDNLTETISVDYADSSEPMSTKTRDTADTFASTPEGKPNGGAFQERVWQNSIMVFNADGVLVELYWNGKRQSSIDIAPPGTFHSWMPEPVSLGALPFGPIAMVSLGFDGSLYGVETIHQSGGDQWDDYHLALQTSLQGRMSDMQVYDYMFTPEQAVAHASLSAQLCAVSPPPPSPPEPPSPPPRLTKCGLGKFINATGCWECPRGTFSDTLNSQECQACPIVTQGPTVRLPARRGER